MRSTAATTTFECASHCQMASTVVAASRTGVSSLASAVVPRAFLPVGAGVFVFGGNLYSMLHMIAY